MADNERAQFALKTAMALNSHTKRARFTDIRIPPAITHMGKCDQCGKKVHMSASRCIECARKEFP